MGRKRKTRWRRLSIGGNSGNEEEEAERESEILGFSKMNPASRHRSDSTPAIVNTYATFDQSSPSPLPVMNGTNNSSSVGKYGGPGGHSPRDSKSSDESSNGGSGGVNGYSSNKDAPASHHNNPRAEHHHHYNNGYNNGSQNNHHNYNNFGYSGGKEPRRTEGEGSNYGNNGYYPSSNYYHHRNSYNNPGGSSSYRGSGGYEGSGGYRGRGGGDYHHSSRFGGRFRKPRPYSSNYYYNNGPSSATGSNEDGTPNRPSYNQEEYTKITTPRQDVLFKKGYLSQRKPVTQSSSVDSTSGPTTPSTNGTPDTHSTNGINSDFSEGYENGETDCGVLPYDDTVYYGPPPETAVFTDPNTGQVYYGQSNGEYFDAYPVMMGGYPAPVYYHVPYPAGLDWNGLPTPIYPLVPLGPPPLDDHQTVIQSGEVQKGDGSSTNGDPEVNKGGGKKADSGGPTPGLTNGTHKNSKSGGSKKNGSDGGVNGTLSDSSTSSREGSSSTFSSAASTPMSPLVNGSGAQLGALATSMSNMHLGSDGGFQPHFQHQPIHPGIPVSHFMGPPPPANHLPHPHHHHPQQILYHPHPATFVYAPPIYNGVVVPIAPAASTAESQSSPSPSSRKKRKLRRRKKDDGQLTDESSSEEEETLEESKDQSILSPTPNSNHTETLDPLLTPTSSEPTTSSETSPSKSSNSAAVARKKDLLVEESTPSHPHQEQSSGTLLENKIESSQIPLEGDETVKPKQENTTAEQTVNSEEKEVPPAAPEEQPQEPLIHIRKPQDLTLGLNLISVSLEEESAVLLSLKSPAEPSSPDSFNTTQSVAGSDVPSVSISETDFMNRTTSVDEVEEDLPQEFLLENTPTPPDPIKIPFSKLKSRSIEESWAADPKRGPPLCSDAVPIPPPSQSTVQDFAENSPISILRDAVDLSPSPETIFERQLELPVLPPLKVETQNFLSSTPLEPTGLVCNEVYDAVDSIQVDSSTLPSPGRPCISATVPLSLASDDVQHSVQIQETKIQEPKVIEETTPIVEKRPTICASPIERPQSITLAVAEWLKVQGSDALTPVNQLQDIFQEEADDESWTEEDESEEDHLTTGDLAQLDPTTSGLPVQSASPSNCVIQ